MTPLLIWNPHMNGRDPDLLRRDVRKDEDAFYKEYAAPTPVAWLRMKLQALSQFVTLTRLPWRRGAEESLPFDARMNVPR